MAHVGGCGWVGHAGAGSEVTDIDGGLPRYDLRRQRRQLLYFEVGEILHGQAMHGVFLPIALEELDWVGRVVAVPPRCSAQC